MRHSIDVKTGRFARPRAGFGKNWKSHRDLEAWWVLTIYECDPSEYEDGRTFEVCVHNIGAWFSIPVWPVLVFHDAEEAKRWFVALCVFLKTLPAANNHEFYDPNVNGDRRLASWLTAHGFIKHNHIWWVKAPEGSTSACS